MDRFEQVMLYIGILIFVLAPICSAINGHFANTQKGKQLQKQAQEQHAQAESLKQKETELHDKASALCEKEATLLETERSLEKRIATQEKQLADTLEKEQEAQMQRILHAAANRPYFKDTRVYAELRSSENIFENERFHKAVTEKMSITSSMYAGTDISSGTHTYRTTLDNCTCPDFLNRGIPCKHMYRLAIDLGILSSFDGDTILVDYNNKKEQINHDLIEWERACRQYKRNQTMLQAIGKIRVDSLQKSSEFVSELYADYLDIQSKAHTQYLLSQKRPALKAAERMKELRKEKKEAVKKAKLLEYQLHLYESLFPWLTEYQALTPQDAKNIAAADSDISEHEQEYDSMRRWLSPDEYQKLSTAEKYQLALDRYAKRKKSNWEVGIEYERYVGYLYEKDGYTVKYSGALLKLEDMGRDLIAYKGNQILVIQCKRWAQEKVIHEKHIFQLYGTTILLAKQYPEHTITPVFCTTTELSETAKYCAEKMGVVLREKLLFEEHPVIKCNVSKTGEKIYHLPFDQQYDRINMSDETHKLYAQTVAEAEALGFRRAWRWHSK